MNASKESIVRVSAAEARRMKGKTDYARLDAMTDDDIAKAVAEDPDAAPLDIDWDKASLVIPHTAKDVITLRLDHDILEWLRSTGPGYQTRINKVLRSWYEATRKRDEPPRIKIKPKPVRKAGSSAAKTMPASRKAEAENEALDAAMAAIARALKLKTSPGFKTRDDKPAKRKAPARSGPARKRA